MEQATTTTTKNKDMMTIKFNSKITPKMKWNEKLKKFDSVIGNLDFRHELIKLQEEEGDTPEETKKLKRLHTSRWNLRQHMDHIYGAVNDKETVQFYSQNEIVTLPVVEAEYYCGQYCGGILTVRGIEGKIIKTTHKKNIDDSQGHYTKNEMARFEREHVPVPVAEVYNG